MMFGRACLLVAALLLTQPAPAADDDWQFLIAPYLWGVSIDGESQIGTTPPAEIDAGFDDILSNLNLALSAHSELKYGRWTVALDPTYISLEIDDAVSGRLGSVDLEIDIWLVELWAAYEFVEGFDLMAGARYQSQSIDGDGSINLPPPGPNPVGGEIADEDWTDWFIGVRTVQDLSENWFYVARADAVIGGDSDSSWNFLISANRWFGSDEDRFLMIGYRFFTDDFETGSGDDLFRWDVDQTGPYVGYTWIF